MADERWKLLEGKYGIKSQEDWDKVPDIDKESYLKDKVFLTSFMKINTGKKLTFTMIIFSGHLRVVSAMNIILSMPESLLMKNGI